MSKKINKKFLKLFVELDSSCCDKLGVKAGGVTEYINRLESARFAPKLVAAITIKFHEEFKELFVNLLAHLSFPPFIKCALCNIL